jgi:hypothetical protein
LGSRPSGGTTELPHLRCGPLMTTASSCLADFAQTARLVGRDFELLEQRAGVQPPASVRFGVQGSCCAARNR